MEFTPEELELLIIALNARENLFRDFLGDRKRPESAILLEAAGKDLTATILLKGRIRKYRDNPSAEQQ